MSKNKANAGNTEMKLDYVHITGALDALGIVPWRAGPHSSVYGGLEIPGGSFSLHGGIYIRVYDNQSAYVTWTGEGDGEIEVNPPTFTMVDFISQLVEVIVEHDVPVQRRGVPMAALMLSEGYKKRGIKELVSLN